MYSGIISYKKSSFSVISPGFFKSLKIHQEMFSRNSSRNSFTVSITSSPTDYFKVCFFSKFLQWFALNFSKDFLKVFEGFSQKILHGYSQKLCDSFRNSIADSSTNVSKDFLRKRSMYSLRNFFVEVFDKSLMDIFRNFFSDLFKKWNFRIPLDISTTFAPGVVLEVG